MELAGSDASIRAVGLVKQPTMNGSNASWRFQPDVRMNQSMPSMIISVENPSEREMM